jgi:hypothetical protein
MRRIFSLLALILGAVLSVQSVSAQQSSVSSPEPAHDETPAALQDAPSPAQQNQSPQAQPASAAQNDEGKQTKRILGIIPNFRAVSVDEKLPPVSTRDKFKLTIEDSFDYSDATLVAILAGISQLQDSYPEFHTGAPAYARYYWHAFADNLDGNLMTEFIFPVATREDPRYYTLGRGGFVKRSGYALSRLFVTRTDRDGSSPNLSEVLGNGAGAGIANLYYPSQERTLSKTGDRWATQIAVDGLSNLIKEFWPDVNSKLFHNKY